MKKTQATPTANDFVKSIDRSMRKKKITLVVLLVSS